MLSPAQTTKFSLTISLAAFLARVYDEQVFPPTIFLDKFQLLVCTQLN